MRSGSPSSAAIGVNPRLLAVVLAISERSAYRLATRLNAIRIGRLVRFPLNRIAEEFGSDIADRVAELAAPAADHRGDQPREGGGPGGRRSGKRVVGGSR
jgi:hypothetical protein